MLERRDEWACPRDIVEFIRLHFNPGLDVAATAKNTVCEYFYDRKDDALNKPWSPTRVNYCCPGIAQYPLWMDKAIMEATRGCTTIMVATHTVAPNVMRYYRRIDKIICLTGARIPFGGGEAPNRDVTLWLFTPWGVSLSGMYQDYYPQTLWLDWRNVGGGAKL